jgi:outer membrane protein assembly factor BamB
MLLLEFLNRISFFSVLTWSFYLIAVLCALILTNYSSPLTRKHRKSLIAVGVSSLILGTLSWSSPFFMSKINPLQSKLVAIDSLVTTQWEEPVTNPDTELSDDEIGWQKALPYRFKYKLKMADDFRRSIAIEGSELVYIDEPGNLRGFNAYSGLNHWHIPIHANQILGQVITQKRLYLLDGTHSGQLRVSSFDLTNPSLLWQRSIPNSKDGSISFDTDSQSVLITAGNSGVWALKAKTGEILWKRPEIFSHTKPLVSQKHVIIFEPVIANKTGAWYFLDPQTGKTLQKTPHVYGDIQAFLAYEHDSNPAVAFLGRVDSENFFYMNESDLSQVWNYHAPEKIQVTEYIDADHFLFLTAANVLEFRTLKDNSIVYQKKLSNVKPDWLRISPDQAFVAIPSSVEDETPGVTFFKLNTGDYVANARTSEPIRDQLFFGDWMYLFSENYVWAFKK